MWNRKCTIIPEIFGATGIVTRSLRKNLEAVPRRHSIDSLKKTTKIGTSHIIRKALQCEACSLRGGDHRWFERSTKNKNHVRRDPCRIIKLTVIIINIFCSIQIPMSYTEDLEKNRRQCNSLLQHVSNYHLPST